MTSKNKKQAQKRRKPSQAENIELIFRAKRLVGTPTKYFARVFKRTPGRISQAFGGHAPNLLNKIIKHVELLETKKNATSI